MIQIQESTIIEAAEKGPDEFLKVFTDAYLEALGGDITAENMGLLNGYQHTLLALRFISEEVNEGGFVQLIQNGYGGYIFKNPVAKALKQMGAARLSKILYKAKEIYDATRKSWNGRPPTRNLRPCMSILSSSTSWKKSSST